MFCSKCGNQMENDAVFCDKCGTPARKKKDTAPQPPVQPQPQPVAPQPAVQPQPQPVAPVIQPAFAQPQPTAAVMPAPKKSVNKALIILPVIAVVVVAVVLVFVFCFGGEAKAAGRNTIGTFQSDNEQLENKLIYNGKVLSIDEGLRGWDNCSMISSLDGTGWLFCGRGDTESLFCLHDGEIISISDDFIQSYYVYGISDLGDMVYYLDLEERLHLFNCITKADMIIEEKMGENAAAKLNMYNGYPQFSPSGNELLYATYNVVIKDVKGYTDVYAYRNGKSVLIAENASPISISDGGKYIFYADEATGHIFLTDIDLSFRKDIGTRGRLYINNKRTQIIRAMGECFFYDAETEEKIMLPEGLNLPLATEEKLFYYSSAIVNRDSLLGLYYGTVKNLRYLDENCEITYISDKCRRLKITRDDNTVYYLDDGALYRTTKTDLAPEKLVNGGVVSFGVSDDERSVYFARENGELWLIRDNGTPKLISAENSRDIGACIIGNDLVYIGEFSKENNEGKLYVYTEAGEKRKLADDDYGSVGYFYVWSPESIFERNLHSGANLDGAIYRNLGFVTYMLDGEEYIYTAGGRSVKAS